MINFPPESSESDPRPTDTPARNDHTRGNGQVGPGGHARRIPFVDVHAGQYARANRRSLASGWVENGPEVAAWETEFATAVGARSGVAVSSGATALELALVSLRLPWGSRVLLSTLGSSGAVQAIVRAGLCPVLMDVSSATGMPTAQIVGEAARRAGIEGRPARAMVVVHLAGDPADVSDLREAAALPSDRVVQDASEALGSRLGTAPVGGAGTACFSFYASANLPVGQGGMVTTEHAELADRVRQSRSHGATNWAWRPHTNGNPLLHSLREGGLAASLTDLSAAIGRSQLVHLSLWQQHRRRLAERYDERLVGISGVVLPHRPSSGAGEHAWHHYSMRIEHPEVHRDAVIRALDQAGIGTAEQLVPLHHLGYVLNLCEVPSDGLPGADRFVGAVLSLPVYPRVPEDTADRVADVLTRMLDRPAA